MTVGNSQQLGYKSIIGIAEETTYGTKADPAAFVEFNSEAFKQNREEIKIEAINTGRDFIRRLMGNESVEGSLEFNLNVGEDAILYMLKQGMGGTVGSALISTGAYLHTFVAGDMENNESTSGATDTKSLTFQIRKGADHNFDFTGCRVNTFTIKGEIGSPVVMSAEVIGKTASVTASTPTAVFTDVVPMNFTGITVTTGNTITTLVAETFLGFELTVNNNLVSDSNARQLGSRTVQILPPTRREVMLKLTQRFDTTTCYDRFIEATQTAIQISMDSFQTIGATEATYNMAIRLPNCYFNSNMPEVGDIGVLTHELEISSIKANTTTGYTIEVDVQNATANY